MRNKALSRGSHGVQGTSGLLEGVPNGHLGLQVQLLRVYECNQMDLDPCGSIRFHMYSRIVTGFLDFFSELTTALSHNVSIFSYI